MEIKPPRPLRVYVDHGEAYGNLGDEAMLLNALSRLEHYLGPCEFILPAEEGKPLPNYSEHRVTLVKPPHLAFRFWAFIIRCVLLPFRVIPGLRSWLRITDESRIWRWVAVILHIWLTLNRWHLWPWIGKTLTSFSQALRHCDAFYGVGAADFNDFNLNGLIYKSWLYKVMKPRVKVSAVAAQGIGPISTPWAVNLMKNTFECVDILSFRDHKYSNEVMASLNPKHVRTAIVGDEAFSLPSSPTEDVNRFLRETGIKPYEPFIVFNWRMTDYTRDTTWLIPHIAVILDAVGAAVPATILFLPMSYHTHSTLDEVCGWAIRGAMKHPERMTVVPLCKDVHLVKGIVGAARYSLGLSYHIHVFSLSQGHPALILYSGEYYRYKSEGLIGFYGLPNAAIDVEKGNIRDIVQSVSLIESSYEEACSSIQKVNEEILKVNDWTIKEMANVILRNHQQ